MAQSFTRRQSVLRLLGSLVFVAAAGFWIRAGEVLPLAWVCLVFFGAAALGWGYLAVTGRPNIARFQPEEGRIVLESGGFAVLTTRGRRFPVSWASVRRVSAYKRDRVTTDEIWVAFESDEFAGVQEVSEEWPGFQELFGPMETELGIRPAWYVEIMVPAFEPMHRVLFDRADTAAPDTRPVGPDRERAG